MTDYYKRGDILIVDLDPVQGSEQGGSRPCCTIQNNFGNRYSHTIIVVPITTSAKKELPTHIHLNDVDVLKPESILLLEQIRTIDIDRIQKYLGSLDEAKMKVVDEALAISVGLTDIKRKGLTLTLCATCARIFYDSPYHDIRRTDPNQVVKEPCTYCSKNSGFSFEVFPKKNLK